MTGKVHAESRPSGFGMEDESKMEIQVFLIVPSKVDGQAAIFHLSNPLQRNSSEGILSYSLFALDQVPRNAMLKILRGNELIESVKLHNEQETISTISLKIDPVKALAVLTAYNNLEGTLFCKLRLVIICTISSLFNQLTSLIFLFLI
jgi:hypothetical protein